MAKNRINKICREVLSITEEEFNEMYDVANGQLEYNDPLKPATSGWQLIARRKTSHLMIAHQL